MSLDLPTALAGVIALAVLLYVFFDGFDLGIGILFPFARSREDRDLMINTIAPVWDGNETWLVMGGGGLLAAFPVAFGVLMSALYLPLIAMLIALVFRGVAFEFRLRGGRRGRPLWTAGFAGGSLAAAFAQGLVLGGFIQGIRIEGGVFAGGPFDWLTPYTLLVACGVAAGYALLGATWLMFKSQDQLHGDARLWAGRAAVLTAAFLLAVSLATLFLHPRIADRWGVSHGVIDWARLIRLAPVPLIGAAGLALTAWSIRRGSHGWPFVGAGMVFVSGYLGLAVGFTPFIVPYALTIDQAASPPKTLELLVWALGLLLPLILGYTAFVYWIFRGKVTADGGYH